MATLVAPIWLRLVAGAAYTAGAAVQSLSLLVQAIRGQSPRDPGPRASSSRRGHSSAAAPRVLPWRSSRPGPPRSTILRRLSTLNLSALKSTLLGQTMLQVERKLGPPQAVSAPIATPAHPAGPAVAAPQVWYYPILAHERIAAAIWFKNGVAQKVECILGP